MSPAGSLSTPVIAKFDPFTATPAEFKALNSFVNLIRREGWPSESLTKWDEFQRSKRFLPSFAERHIWTAHMGRQLSGAATLELAHTAHNRHVAGFFIEVRPEVRRRGIGTDLLARVYEVARGANRTLLTSWTSHLVPAGEDFMRRIGALAAQEMSVYQLQARDLRWDLIHAWMARGESLAPELELGCWQGKYPEARLGEIAEMRAVMNTMPRGALEIEDEEWTASQLREQDAILQRQGTERWTIYARCQTTGRIAGYTEVFWNPSQPGLANQGDTGVFPRWRNRGLGAWLKAAMVQQLLGVRPTVQRIWTWNATANLAMIRINEQMGFKLQQKSLNWQIRTDTLGRLLSP
jgi:GNAT superfamily N-acetyltransferase